MKILDINKFIKDNNVLEVTNGFSFGKEGVSDFTDDGLYSKRIFGSSSHEISTRYGYINLNSTIMHPAVYSNINKIKTTFKHCLANTKKYKIVDGELIEDENGKSGVGWLFHNWNMIQFDKYKHQKNAKFIELVKQKDKVFINKFLVIPKKYRSPTEKNGRPIEDDLTGLYKKLLFKIQSSTSENEFMKEMLKDTSRDSYVQNDVNNIYNYFLDNLKSKEGHLRGSLISKRIDNNTRLVANARPDIPFDCIAIPWHVLLNIFDAFVIGYLRDKDNHHYLTDLKISDFNDTELAEHFTYIFQNSDTYVKNYPGLREKWVNLLKEMFEYHHELRVMCKRDPAWSKKSYTSAKPVIIPDNSYHVIVNSNIYKNFGGDSFNTNITVKETNTKTLINNPNYTITLENNIKHIKRLNTIIGEF